MLRIILLFVVFVTSSLLTSSIAQSIWKTSFDVPEKGVWANSEGELVIDTTGIDWLIDFQNCEFSNENDYAKTVTTSGGRFEVLDCDGTVKWYSPELDISEYDFIHVQLKASETGSSTSREKKFVRPKIVMDGQIISFSADSIAEGNWGELSFQETLAAGSRLQLVVEMNSSYSNDKVYIDDVVIEGVDAKLLQPSEIKLVASENVIEVNDTFVIAAEILNGYGQVLNDEKFDLEFKSFEIVSAQKTFVDGIYRWKVIASKQGEVSYQILSTNFSLDSISKLIYVVDSNSVQFINTFEDDFLNDPTSDWEIDSLNAIGGYRSLKHQEKEENGLASFLISTDSINSNKGHFQFKYKLKNGDWNPSTSNNFQIELANDGGGYAFGVNLTGSSDLFSMWKITRDQVPELLVETNFQWIENTFAGIEIFRTVNGDWTIFLRDEQSFILGTAIVSDSEYSVFTKQVLNFEYTKTRSGQLWLDDVKVSLVDVPPSILSVESVEIGVIQIKFNEPVDRSSFDIDHIAISSNQQNCEILEAKFVNLTTLEVRFLHNEKLAYEVLIDSIKDVNGQQANDLIFNFFHAVKPRLFEIIINEVMADPSPTQGLPEVEYVELYNNSSHFLRLNDGRIAIGGHSKLVPEVIIEPQSYLVVCDEDDTASFTSEVNCLPIRTFPALLNSGTSIIIWDGTTMIDSIVYNEDWYHSSSKADGGFSLEKIDPNRNCGSINNWVASENESGGTPGFQNSVFSTNIDSFSPTIQKIELLTANQVKIDFSERIDTSIFPEIKFNPKVEIARSFFHEDCRSLTIEFTENIWEDQEYEVLIPELSDECGNVSLNEKSTFIWHHLLPKDVFLTELLFNPLGDGDDFYEIYNACDYAVDLSKIKVATRDDSLKLKSIYPLADSSIYMNSNAYLAFTKDVFNIEEQYSLSTIENIHSMGRLPAFNNDHGIIVLLNDSLEVIDEFEYDEEMHSEFISENDGVSLERISLSAPTNLASNWFSGSSLSNYATPGYSINAVSQNDLVSIEFSSDVVSPNFDNFNDDLVIKFLLDESTYLVNLFVFSANGKLENQAMNNQLIVNGDEFILPIVNKNGQNLRSGVYFVLAELLTEQGFKHQIRKSFYVKN